MPYFCLISCLLLFLLSRVSQLAHLLSFSDTNSNFFNSNFFNIFDFNAFFSYFSVSFSFSNAFNTNFAYLLSQ